MTQSLNLNGGLLEWLRKNWPILVVLAGFILRVELFMGAGPRFTSKDAAIMESRIMQRIDERFDSLPPGWYRDQVRRDIERLETKIDQLMEELRREHSR